MTSNKSNLKKLSILLAIILLAVLIPQYQSYADVAGIPTSTADLVTGALQEINKIMLEGVGTILKWAALTLEAVVRPETQAVIINTFVVQESWRIIRDFVNMFFILFLIIMAFGTIFDSSKYSWKVGRPPILVTFLIAALLINFSLVIGQYVIEIGNGLAAIFLRQIAGFGQDMATGFDIGKAIPGGEFKAQGLAMIANDSARAIFTGIFSLIFLIIALFAFLAALLFTIIRIPILWFLLIVSPIAWIGYILPNIRGQTWSKWWNALISWVFFLPVYLFFLMFAVMFIRRKIEVTAALPSAQGAALFTGPGGALSDLLFYILTVLFMVFGLKAAYSVGSFAANGAGKLMGGIEKGVKKYMPGAGYVRAVGAGAKEGLKAKGEEIKEKGVFGIGGAQAERLRQAKWTERFGFGAARGAAEKQLMEEVNKLKGQFEKISDISELKRLANTAPKYQQLAAREVLQSREELTVDEQLATYRLYGGKDSLAAQKFAKGIDFARVSSEERGRLYDAIEDPEIRRKIINIRADKGDLKGVTAEDLRRYATLFIQEGDQREFLNKALKFAFEESIKAQVELKLVKDSAGNPVTDVAEAIAEKVRKMRLDDILELSKGSLQKLVQENPEAARIIAARLNKETIASIPGKVDSERMEILEGMLTKRKGELEAEETERQQKAAAISGEAQVKTMQPLVDAIKELMETVRKTPTTGRGAGGPIGFVPPGSQVTPEGKVIPPEKK